MRTIMFYINQIYDGGAERVMVYLANHFAELGYTSVLVTSFRHKGEYSVADNVIRYSIERKETDAGALKKNINRIRVLRSLIKKHHPEVLVSFLPQPNFRAMVATIGFPTKNIISVRWEPSKEYAGFVPRFLARHLLVHADGCVFQTKGAKAWFSKRLQEKSVIIMNPVGDQFYDVKRHPQSQHFVTCGRLDPAKNQHMLIDAFAKVYKKFPDSRLAIYGRGELEQELSAHIAKLGLDDIVVLAGQTDNVPKILAESDVFVLSSDLEGMPNALLEAMAMGLPCISTDCPPGGPREVLEGGKNGKLVPVGDTEGLAKAMMTLLENEEEKEALGKAAAKKAKEFRGDQVFAQWEDYVLYVADKER